MKIEFISALCLSDPEACKKMIVQEVPEAALYEQMAEEAAELAKWSVESIIRMRSDRKMLGGSWRDDVDETGKR